MAIYKALDVRELVRVGVGSATNHNYSSSNSIEMRNKEYTIVIAKDIETGDRVRLELKEAYEDTFMGKVYYNGYTGDFHLLVPGDTFEIEVTSTYRHLTILEVE